MKRKLSNTICGLKFAMEKNDFERLKSSNEKKRNDFVVIPIIRLGFVIYVGQVEFKEVPSPLR